MSKALGSGLKSSVMSAVRGMTRAARVEDDEEKDGKRSGKPDDDEKKGETDDDEAKAETDEDEPDSKADEDEVRAETDEDEAGAGTDGDEKETSAEADENKDGKSAGAKNRAKAAISLMKSADARGREKLAAELADEIVEGSLSAKRASAILASAPKASRLGEAMAGRDVDPGSDSGRNATPGSGLKTAVERRYGSQKTGR